MQAGQITWDQIQASDQMEVQDPMLLNQMEVSGQVEVQDLTQLDHLEVLDRMEVQDQMLLDLLEVLDQMEVQDPMLQDLMKGQDRQEVDKLEMVMEDHLDLMEEDKQATLLELGQVVPLTLEDHSEPQMEEGPTVVQDRIGPEMVAMEEDPQEMEATSMEDQLMKVSAPDCQDNHFQGMVWRRRGGEASR